MEIKNISLPLTQTENWIPLLLHNVKYIVIHHIASIKATEMEINQWHLNNGWIGGIAYNEYIKKDGTVIICRGDHIGGHTLNYNEISYGISCEGNYDTEKTMPDQQFKSLINRLAYNIQRMPQAEIVPHSTLTNTSCPGKNFPIHLINITKTMPIIRLGAVGEAVSFLQKSLNDIGYNCGNVDGVFGNNTFRALRLYQSDHDLEPDGICGKLTWAKIMKR